MTATGAYPSDYISLTGVGKRYGAITALHEINLNIEAGEFFALLGPSGCGKTTLLRILAGLETPTAGSVVIDGQDMTAVPPFARPTNMVFQNYALFPHLSVARNIGYGLINSELPRTEVRRRVDAMLEMIRLAGYGERRITELSGGEKQRIAVARALIRAPKVLLLDEPLGALDKKLREAMQLELRTIQRQSKTTFVFVTHDQEEALTMADRVAVMTKGRLLQVGTPRALYETPNSIAVASFLGSVNLIGGRLARRIDAHSAAIEVAGVGELVGSTNGEVLVAGGPVSLAIRPERMAVSTTRPDGAQNVLRGTVTTQAYAGDRSTLYVRQPETGLELAVQLPENQPRGAGVALKEGDAVWVHWDPAAGRALT